MIEFSSLLGFSHTHCVAICAVLVPLNLLATLQTIVLTGLERLSWVWKTAGLASLCAGIMVLHVLTWFLIGVIAIQTFVLLTLGSVCLGVNLWAVFHPQSLRRILVSLGQVVLRTV
ncbi:MAG: hypothetical protein K6T90_09185 [Leptolyngbyaceae cyanobacterium HOT.MB2.61]|jgi:hypothetical protein|nr:hypothetical protein [Leptolyngbyaceae cyanobacterium HOT.MB2.61]